MRKRNMVLAGFGGINSNMRYLLIILGLVSFSLSEQSESDSYDILILINGDRYVGEYLSELNQEQNIAFKPIDSKYPQYVDLDVIKSLMLSNGHYVSIDQLNKIQNLEFEVEDLKNHFDCFIKLDEKFEYKEMFWYSMGCFFLFFQSYFNIILFRNIL